MKSDLKYLTGALLTMPFLPFLYMQGKQIRASVPVLPEAGGTSGLVSIDSDREFNLISIGESAMAGVGVDLHESAFTGELARILASDLDVNVRWKVYAQRGLTAKRVREELIPGITESRADLIVVQLGANDTFALHSPGRWKRDIIELITAIRETLGSAPIAFTNMPPIRDFPAFTKGIKLTLGSLIDLLGNELKELTASDENIYYNQRRITIEDWTERLNVKADPDEYFCDGVHPSELTYKVWARDFAGFLDEVIGKERMLIEIGV